MRGNGDDDGGITLTLSGKNTSSKQGNTDHIRMFGRGLIGLGIGDRYGRIALDLMCDDGSIELGTEGQI